jgi:hypothetical protein
MNVAVHLKKKSAKLEPAYTAIALNLNNTRTKTPVFVVTARITLAVITKHTVLIAPTYCHTVAEVEHSWHSGQLFEVCSYHPGLNRSHLSNKDFASGVPLTVFYRADFTRLSLVTQ